LKRGPTPRVLLSSLPGKSGKGPQLSRFGVDCICLNSAYGSRAVKAGPLGIEYDSRERAGVFAGGGFRGRQEVLRCVGIRKKQISISRAAHVCQAISTMRGGRQKWKCASTLSCHAILPLAVTTPLILVAGAGSCLKEVEGLIFGSRVASSMVPC